MDWRLNRGGTGNRLLLKALAPTTATLLVLAGSVQAGPSATSAGIRVAATPTVPPVGAGWGGMPMGQRSADAHFIVMMIPHHQGAIAMSELALTRARRPEIKALAQRIIASQSREITQMRQWYRQWYGSDVPSWGIGAGSGYGNGNG